MANVKLRVEPVVSGTAKGPDRNTEFLGSKDDTLWVRLTARPLKIKGAGKGEAGIAFVSKTDRRYGKVSTK